jgi:plastocyanin
MRRMLTTAAAAALLASLALAAPAAAERKTHTLRFGPISVGKYAALKRSNDSATPGVTGSIVAMDANLVDADGQVVPQSQVMLHHLVYFDVGYEGAPRYDGTCPKKPAERFYGTSEELRPMTLPDGYGYPIDAQDRWRMAWMVMNHTSSARKVFIEAHVTTDDAPGIAPVKPYWVSVVPCGADPQYTVPGGRAPGTSHVKRIAWKVPLDGRIVAVGGHLHGGARRIALGQPRCANRTLVTSRPTYGPPDDPLYRVRPPLHEPDPRSISWWQSATGVPVVAGEELTVSSVYDAERAHMRVMGIDHVYVAPDAAASRDCDPVPADAVELGPDFEGGRAEPPPVKLTLAQLGGDGVAHPIDAPPGTTRSYERDASIRVGALAFRPSRVSIPAGGRVRWRYFDPVDHDATMVTGPQGFGAPWSRRGDSFTRRFDVPGTYRVYCSLHPARMSQLIRVRAR